jgi:HEAT repeat protein
MNRTTCISFATLLFLAALPPVVANAKLDKETAAQVHTVLDRATRSGDHKTRALAIESYAAYRPKEGKAEAINALKDPVWLVRAAAIRALIRLKNKTANEALYFAMTNPRRNVDKELIPLLEMLGDKAAVALALRVMHDKRAVSRRKSIVTAFAKAPLKRFLGFFKPLLTDKDEAVANGIRDFTLTLDRTDALSLYTIIIKVGSANLQLRALDSLIKFPKGSKLSFVRKLLKSSNNTVAVRAAEVLAHHGDRSAIKRLLPELETKNDKRIIRALDALVHVAGPQEYAVLTPFLRKKDVHPDILSRVVEIHYRNKDRQLVGTLRKLRRRDNIRSQAIAIYYMGLVEKGRALPALHESLFHGNPIVRLAAAKAIGGIGSRESISHIRRALDNVRANEIKLTLVKALANIKDREIVPIVRFLVTDADPRIQKWAIIALTRVAHKDAVEALKSAMEVSRDLDAQSQALLAIIQLDKVEGLTSFRNALRWIPPRKVREIAAVIKGGFVVYLSMALTSRRSEIRDVALDLLKNHPKHENALLLTALARTRNLDLKLKILKRLAKRNGKAESTRLQVMATNSNIQIKITSLYLLGEIRDKGATEILKKALFDPNERARVAAGRALFRIHGRR